MGNVESEKKEDFETYTKDEFDQLQIMQVKNLDTKEVSNLLDFEAEFYKQKLEEKKEKNNLQEEEEFQILFYNGTETQKLIKEMKLISNKFSTIEQYKYKELIIEKIENCFQFLIKQINLSNLKSNYFFVEEFFEKKKFFFTNENFEKFIDFFNEYEVQKVYLKYNEEYSHFENFE